MNLNRFFTCSSKVKFTSQVKAENKARAIYKKDGPAMTAYKCPYCDGWHLTAQRKK